jgi:hypothetical protein
MGLTVRRRSGCCQQVCVHPCVAALNGSWERRSSADPKHPEIRVNSLKFYVCATVVWHHGCMSDEYSFSLHLASAEYSELAVKLRELVRARLFPGPRRSLLQLTRSLDRRATHPLRLPGGREGAPRSARRPNAPCGLVGLLTVISCLPGLKTLLQPEEARNNRRWP